MNAKTRQYLFGTIFLAVGFFQVYRNAYMEASLYLLAGLAFIFNTLVSEPGLFNYKKILTIITWLLIISTAIVFLYVIQSRYL